MDLTEDIKPISYVKANTAKVMQGVVNGKPLVITQNGEPKAVVLAVAHYQKLKDLLSVFKLLAIGDNDLRNKRIVRHEDLDKKIRDLVGG